MPLKNALYNSVEIQTMSGHDIQPETDEQRIIISFHFLLTYLITSGILIVSVGFKLSAATGAPVAQRLRRLATASRQRQQDELLRKVRGLSVRAVVPLGVCFLPAFLLLAVVPLVASLATGLAG